MNQLPKVLQSKTKIRFQDCDPFNHLNNGSYINYFMNHREDALIENYNIDIYKMAKLYGKSWVSSSNQIAYLKPAFLMETVIIDSQLIRFTDNDLLVEMRMFNSDKSQLKTIIWSSFTFFDLQTQRKDIHTEDFMSLFKTIHHPIEESFFEERVLAIKSKK